MSATERLTLDDGTTGTLRAVPPWSCWVDDVRGPSAVAWLTTVEQRAAAAEVLDLRSSATLPGFVPLTAVEAVRPVPQPLADAEVTRSLGRRIAPSLRAGDLLVLSGPLGAGKTTFTQALGEALGVRGRVTSPTFVLARVHRGPLPLVHVDAYRLREPGADAIDLDDLGLDAALDDAVTVVEWGEGVVEHLSDSRLEVALCRPAGQSGADAADARTAVVRCVGPRWAAGPPEDVAGR